jgi:hypothetical protein
MELVAGQSVISRFLLGTDLASSGVARHRRRNQEMAYLRRFLTAGAVLAVAIGFVSRPKFGGGVVAEPHVLAFTYPPGQAVSIHLNGTPPLPDATGVARIEKRAESVRDYLVEQGVPATSITVKGLGESQPVATNDTAAGRQGESEGRDRGGGIAGFRDAPDLERIA